MPTGFVALASHSTVFWIFFCLLLESLVVSSLIMMSGNDEGALSMGLVSDVCVERE